MTSAKAMAAAPPPRPLTPRAVLAAWRGITVAQLRTTFLLGLALQVWFVVAYLNPETPNLGVTVLAHSAFNLIAVFAMLPAVVVADRVTGKDPNRRGPYALAVVVGAAAAAILKSIAIQWGQGFIWKLAGLPWSAEDQQSAMFNLGYTLRIFFEMIMFGAATMWVVIDRRRAHLARARMHAAELERIAAERRSIESDLQAMQARVEPQFLFNTLAQVRDLYGVNKIQSEQMLDELITYLRAAMPKMRDTSSTVGQELELVRAYLGIVRLRLGGRLAFEIDPIETSVADARIPPMMMLPLVDHAITHGFAEPHAKGSIRVRTGVADGKVRLEIADSGVGFLAQAEGDGITGIRERISALYGAGASLLLQRRQSTATEAVLEIPYEVV